MEEISSMLSEVHEIFRSIRTILDASNAKLDLRIRQERFLALCMATHPRLGESAGEGLSRLPSDIIWSLV
jgi:hypothetical protein